MAGSSWGAGLGRADHPVRDGVTAAGAAFFTGFLISNGYEAYRNCCPGWQGHIQHQTNREGRFTCGNVLTHRHCRSSLKERTRVKAGFGPLFMVSERYLGTPE